jgi:hypothetical protein
MNIYNKYNKQEKYLILVRKLKEAFLSFTTDIIDVFPNVSLLLYQYLTANQLPDTSLYKILKNNIDKEMIENENEDYLMNDLILLKDSEQYLNESKEYKNSSYNTYFHFKSLQFDNKGCSQDYKILYEENKDMIWKWLKIFVIMIKNIDNLSE